MIAKDTNTRQSEILAPSRPKRYRNKGQKVIDTPLRAATTQYTGERTTPIHFSSISTPVCEHVCVPHLTPQRSANLYFCWPQ